MMHSEEEALLLLMSCSDLKGRMQDYSLAEFSQSQI